MSDIDTMTDEQLVAFVAERVMGWKPRNGCRHLRQDGSFWNPLDDWNDAMSVVEAMRTKDYEFWFDDNTERDGLYVEATFWTGKQKDASCTVFTSVNPDHTAQRRAILKAAAKAIQEAT